MEEEIKIDNNLEINQALKEFEHEASLEQAKKAPEDKKNSNIPKMVQFIMKLSGLPQKQAEYTLLFFAIIAIGVSIYLFFFSSGNKPKMLTPEMIKQINEYKVPLDSI
ncbi:hypothetical protein A2456_00585 [Candidatus Nomurabacteria bacterium RIFOXYC2_FULL_36_19]|uniref:Uncharacterized protein n=3 Tax=Candidatus Nomuraibacteriota TaxID=1752729 RepID=A0A1F6YWA8_9BACT|nr:MAG: hypothetical protein UR91_C0012G0012 [Candidatus Nomurabacteria bacterium GW2011_GWC2_35_8]OGJ05752.1 MAG: hypothetical protein A2238_00190 [Candidatus Nomurabacteria bacterium RIFOXYA2_FULL_35_9]OGJ06783.1 MAG: hypothetical protein A2192_00960 [Candidatus Nomurabacteria bacterium RIFOXYA1_FULL_35_17]OGJ10689.1 MAG: hypothetical protein A2456_00585 [Candidatus Nomurabacteria bacterium RIFOXYC2_FULL_36_19]OGJ14867.1 MAG: hypothetical protein A2554_00535 [Candidatus Nomurabacteria bacteri